MHLEVHSPEEWAEAVASAWAERLERSPGMRMVLPTGDTPVPVYEAIARRHVSFRDTTVFLLDEFGGLPSGHPQRCDSMIAPFLDAVGVPPDRLVRLDPDAWDLEAECRRYRDRVEDGGLDLVLLGLGHNGHLGLNEPGSSPQATTRMVDLAPDTVSGAARYGGGGHPTFGMTLGMDAILAAREVWLLVTGSHKRPILDQVLTSSPTDTIPATHLHTHPATTIWADTGAFYDPNGA